MRPGMRFLLDVLRGETCSDQLSVAEWTSLLLLAEQENVLPWTSACLRSKSGRLDPILEKALDAIDLDARISAFYWAATLRGILSNFHCRQIPVISLKGPWLAERLYGNASLRVCRDLDLLVRRKDVVAAERLLTAIGFTPAGHPQDYERPWIREDVRVELHHDVENPRAFDFGIESAWGRSQLSSFQGIPARLLAPADELLFLCLHGVRHRFERLSHIVDLGLAFHHLAPRCATFRWHHNSESASVLVLGAIMATRLDPSIAISPEIYDWPRDRNHLERIAGSIWQERILKAADAVSWSAKHKFYLEIEASPRKRFLRRFRHFRILLSRLIDADFTFAAKLHLYRAWQVRLLRPIRLLLSSP